MSEEVKSTKVNVEWKSNIAKNLVKSISLGIGGECKSVKSNKYICKNPKCGKEYDEKPEKCTNIITEYSRELFKEDLLKKEGFNATDEEMKIIEDTKYFPDNRYEGRLKELHQNLVKKYWFRENLKMNVMREKIDKVHESAESEEDWNNYNEIVDEYAEYYSKVQRTCDTIYRTYCAYYEYSFFESFMESHICNETECEYKMVTKYEGGNIIDTKYSDFLEIWNELSKKDK